MSAFWLTLAAEDQVDPPSVLLEYTMSLSLPETQGAPEPYKRILEISPVFF